MALVRRAPAVGRAQVPGAAPAGPVPGGPVPHQAGPSPVSAPPVAPGHEMAAAVPSKPADIWAVVTGLGLTGLGGVGAMGVTTMMAPAPFEVADQMSIFGALLVFAAAVERILEPFSRWMPGRTEQQRYEEAVAAMDNGHSGATNAAAHYKAMVDQARSSRGILMWGLATAAATLLSSAGGFYLLRLLAVDPGWDGVPVWIDALVTGLVVGSGTKPLHDIINRVQKQSNVAQTPI
jgi:hypothetical protein